MLTHMLTHIARIAAGLLAGSFLMGTLGLRPVVVTMGERDEIRLRKSLIAVLRRYLPKLMIACILLSLAAAMTAKSHPEFLREAWASAIWIAIFVLTVSVHRPINRKILGWQPDHLPDEFRSALRRWNRADTIRMYLAITGFILLEMGQTP